MHLNKIISSCIGTLVCISISGIPAFANEVGFKEDQLYYVEDSGEFMMYITKASSDIQIDSKGVSNISCLVAGNTGVTKTEITANIQQYKNNKWTTISTFKNSGVKSCTLSKSSNVTKGYSYRVSSTVKAYSGSKSESKIVVSSVKKY